MRGIPRLCCSQGVTMTSLLCSKNIISFSIAPYFAFRSSLRSTGPNGVFRNWFVLARQTSEEQPNHCHLDQCFTGLNFPLVILTHSSITGNPTRVFAPPPTVWV